MTVTAVGNSTMNRVITVLLADDHALVREALGSWLRAAGDIKVIGEVGSADEAVAIAVREKPDIVLIDIDMPGLLAFDAVRTIRTRSPNTRVVVLSGFFQDQMRRRHNIAWYAALGAGFFSRAATQQRSPDKSRLLGALAVGFEPWRRRYARLSRELREQPYLLGP